MKARGAHPDRALTAVKVRGLRLPGRYADGNGLYLVVDPSGARRWLLRTIVRGKRCDIGLGSAALVPLAEAREKAAALRRLARSGGDPLAERRRERRIVPTFEKAARDVHTEHLPTWRNEKHGDQWLNTLQQYAFPTLGGLRVDQVDAPAVLKVLAPIWVTKPETARRVRQRVGTVLDWATAAGFRSGANPVDGIEKGLPKQPDRSTHHAALPYADVPDFLVALRGSAASEVVRLAFEFLVLTAARTSEVLHATWAEVDLDAAIWTVPGARMKAGRDHKVPLAPRCLDILRRARELAGDEPHVFPGRSRGKPLSGMAFLMALRRMGSETTAHGFRSSFRDWASERTNFPREVCEMALAHVVESKTEAAYRRGDLLEKRRELMATWAAFATRASATVVSLRSA